MSDASGSQQWKGKQTIQIPVIPQWTLNNKELNEIAQTIQPDIEDRRQLHPPAVQRIFRIPIPDEKIYPQLINFRTIEGKGIHVSGVLADKDNRMVLVEPDRPDFRDWSFRVCRLRIWVRHC